ncbi:MAG: hypothetical protein N4A40_13275 [Tissierellales bacterium]|jgi:hypothetical protein|nr:hypothetical protein [Tissierellales bacterium]
MKKLKILILIAMLTAMFGQICYGITYDELRVKHGIDEAYEKIKTREDLYKLRDSDVYKKYERELSDYVSYSDFSRIAFRMAGYEESSLERAEYLGFDKVMREKATSEDLSKLTKGNALRYLFLFNGYDTKGYEKLFEDKNMVTWEEAEELTKGIKPFVWNKEFANKEMWSDEEFIDFVNNNPDAPLYMWTKSFELNGKEITLVDRLKDNHKVKLSDHYKNIPDVNERVFQMLKIVTFNAVKHGGTATFFSDEKRGFIWIGFNGDYLDAQTTDNFRITLENQPWEFKNKNTVITHTFNRMYTLNKVTDSGGIWTGIYPEIFKECIKELYRENYSDEMFDYFGRVAKYEFENDQDRVFNGIDVYYRAEDLNQRVSSKIK